jgi:hypothetical protein
MFPESHYFQYKWGDSLWITVTGRTNIIAYSPDGTESIVQGVFNAVCIKVFEYFFYFFISRGILSGIQHWQHLIGYCAAGSSTFYDKLDSIQNVWHVLVGI